MNDDITSYKQQFDAKLDGIKYLKTYFDPKQLFESIKSPEFEINHWHMKNMIDILQNNKIKGNSILEIGCGPMIMNSLLVSPYFQHLYPGDYNSNFRKPLEGWFLDDPIDFDFSFWIEYVSNLHNIKGVNLTKMTREKFVKTVTVDIHNENVLANDEEPIENLDAIITRFCIDSCSPTLHDYMNAIKNVTRLLNKDGAFLQMGFFEHNAEKCQEGFWELDDKTFTDIRLTKDEIYLSLSQAGLNVIDWKEKRVTCHEEEGFQNTSLFALYAVKI